MTLTGKNNEERIWNFLKSKGLNAYGVAGLMGNLYAESALNPQNLQQTYERSLGFTDSEYTAAVDSGRYTGFVRDSAGYGLAQWTYWSRKEALLTYTKAAGTSIGDLGTQLGFLFKELSGSFPSVLAVLKTATSVRQASDVVLTRFERPADQSENAKKKRSGYGQMYYDRYADAKTSEKNENDAREQQNGGSSSNTGTDKTLAFKVGAVVRFTGSKHYTSANATSGKACKAGKAKVSAVYPTGKHPYHLIRVSGSGSTVYGWVDADDVKAYNEAQSFKVGDKVKCNDGVTKYSNGSRMASWVPSSVLYVRAVESSGKILLVSTEPKKEVYTGRVNASDVHKI